MNKPFHESEEIINMCKREWTSVSSLNVMAGNSLNHACETAIRDLWEIATKETFPKEEFKPFHKPLSYLKKIGIFENYSENSQSFLEKLNGYALDEARYSETQAYKDYTNPKSKNKGIELINETDNFVNETINLSTNEEILDKIKEFNSKRKTS